MFATLPRQPSTTRHGNRFDDATIRAVWSKAFAIPGVDPNQLRKDQCGAIIDWNRYGDTSHKGTGWEIDHVFPVAKGGTDDLNNLQPLQWQNNRAKSDSYPASRYCAVVAAR